jgi:hypothetical protein
MYAQYRSTVIMIKAASKAASKASSFTLIQDRVRLLPRRLRLREASACVYVVSMYEHQRACRDRNSTSISSSPVAFERGVWDSGLVERIPDGASTWPSYIHTARW